MIRKSSRARSGCPRLIRFNIDTTMPAYTDGKRQGKKRRMNSRRLRLTCNDEARAAMRLKILHHEENLVA